MTNRGFSRALLLDADSLDAAFAYGALLAVEPELELCLMLPDGAQPDAVRALSCWQGAELE